VMGEVKVGDWVEAYTWKDLTDETRMGVVESEFGDGSFDLRCPYGDGSNGGYTHSTEYIRHLDQHEIVALKLSGVSHGE
jgi:hypothetical protein